MPKSLQAVSSTLGVVRAALQDGRQRLRAEFLQSRNAPQLLSGHSRLIDAILKSLWIGANMPAESSLIAVGGYGRAELYPASDIDILVLLSREPLQVEKDALESFVGLLWDVGLEVGHSVRTIPACLEAARSDVTVQTSLVDARHICGSRKLTSQLAANVSRSLNPVIFEEAKRLEQEHRHAKHHDTPFALEPNLKEGPGGLRDLQTILWIAKAAGIGANWRDLELHGLISRMERRDLASNEALLKQLRIRLHYLSGRREDRVVFDFQTALAGQMNCVGTGTRRASEMLMQRYFRAAKAITQINTILLQNLAARISPQPTMPPRVLNERFETRGNLLSAIDEEIFENEPSSMLESFLLMQQHQELRGMTASTLRALWRASRTLDAAYRRNPAHKLLFLQILQQPRGIVHEFRRMNQYGILGRYLPEFGRIVGQMQHDLFHVYTVDQHILMVVRNLRRFTMPELAHEFPLASQLMSGFEGHWLLYVAALYHDIAKGRGGDHSNLGAADVRKFSRHHGLAAPDAKLVEFLVAHHLTMSSVAQKQDISDPDVIRAFAAKVGDERYLVALYLFTVADIRGTSPKVWNAWKANLLESLFRATRRVIAGGSVRLDSAVAETQAEAMRLLRLYALSDDVKDDLWAQLDVAYFLRHDANEIAWQTRNLHYRVRGERPVVRARLAPIGEGLQIMLYSSDRKELFARICGYFERANFNIVEAKVHTTHHGYALDTFLVMGNGNTAHYRDMIGLIESELAVELMSNTELGQASRGRISRRVRHFPVTPSVDIRPDDKNVYYVLSVVASDRPGLLYDISRVLARYNVNLHTAKINTLGDRAEDVFLVTGESLSNQRVVLMLEQDLLEEMHV
jgi:[protein-PII] uridylyltransferase